MRDLASNIAFANAWTVAFLNGSAEIAGATIDAAKFGSVTHIGAFQALAGTMGIRAEHSDDGSAWESVPHDDMINRDPSLGTGDNGLVLTGVTGASVENFRVGIRSKKRYHRLVWLDESIGAAGFSTGGTILGNPINEPVDSIIV